MADRETMKSRIIEMALVVGGLLVGAMAAWAGWRSQLDSGTAAPILFGGLFACGAAVWSVHRLSEEVRYPEGAPPPCRTPDDVFTMYAARDFMPAKWPADWSTPIVTKGTRAWRFTAGSVRVYVLLCSRGRQSLNVRVWMEPAKGEALSDDRCSEILGAFRLVGEWIEATVGRSGRAKGARLWLAVPTAGRIRLRDPAPPDKMPTPVGRKLSEVVREVRRYLPEKLPAGWSAPVAVEEGDGWLIDTDDYLVLVGLATTQTGVRLMVALIAASEEDVRPDGAIDVLRHFRNVREFVPDKPVEERPNMLLFCADLMPGGSYEPAARAKATSKLMN
jgi:hypothetical protein